jgi:hypothetical protein
MSKKVRCLSIRSDCDGDEIDSLKEVLEEFGLYVDLGELESQDSHNPVSEVVVSDSPLTNEELEEIREFWPPHHDWSELEDDSPNKNNDVA